MRYHRISFVLIAILTLSWAKNVSDTETPAEKLSQTFAKFKKVTTTVVKAILPYILEEASSEKFDVSAPCRHALFRLLVGVKSLKPWAVHMIDSSAKVIDGILTGTASSFGNFEQCVSIDAREDRKAGSRAGARLFRGQYCSLLTSLPMPTKPKFYSIHRRLDAFKKFENDTGLLGEVTEYLQLFYILPFRAGICIPSTCQKSDIQKIAAGLIDQFMEANVTISRCEVKEDYKIEKYQLPVICTFSVLLLVLTCGTAVDLYFKNKETHDEKSKLSMRLSIRVLKCFSVHSNFLKLMDVESGSEKLKVLHGIRFYTMTWIILGHTYFHINFAMLRNLKIALDLTTDWAFNIVTNASLSVDNFFFISGLLMTFVSYELKEKAGATPKVWMFIIHRFWRFLPMQMSFVGFTLLLPWFGSGPLWHDAIDPMIEACRKDWWANMIFINNFYRSGGKSCVSHSWYLSADLQIYCVCLVIVYFLFRNPRLGLVLNFVCIVASVLTAFLYNYFKDLPPTMLFSQPDFEQRIQLMREVYYTPYHHLSTYCIGVAVGHFLQSSWAKKKIPPLWQLTAWLLTLVLFLSTLLGVHSWNIYKGPGPFVTALYASLSRVGWTIGVAWITWACSTGHGGFMKKLLCWNVLVPLSRLTFGVYLIHPLIQHVFYANFRSGIEARNYLGVFIWFSFTTVSYLLAIVVCMCIESPFISMGSIIFEKHKERIQKHSQKRERQTRSQSCPEPQEKPNGYLYINKLPLPPKCSKASFGSSNDGFICHL